MKVLVLIDAWFPFVGGAQVQIKNLKRALKKKYKVEYFILHSPSTNVLVRFLWSLWVIPQVILIHKKHIVYFKTPEHAARLYRKWIDEPRAKEKIQRQAFEFVQKHHTWKNRCGDLIKILQGRKNHITYLYKEIYENK